MIDTIPICVIVNNYLEKGNFQIVTRDTIIEINITNLDVNSSCDFILKGDEIESYYVYLLDENNNRVSSTTENITNTNHCWLINSFNSNIFIEKVFCNE